MKTILLISFLSLISCNKQGKIDSTEAEIWRAEAIKAEQRNSLGPEDNLNSTGGNPSLGNKDQIRQEIESIDQQIAGLNDRIRLLRRNYENSPDINEEINSIEKQKKDLLSRKRNLESQLS